MEYTFDGIKQEVKNRLSLKNNWKESLYFSTYDRIIDAVTYAIDKSVYQSEFLYKESVWDTATKIESLLIRAIPLQYKAYRKKGATGIVYLSGDSTFSPTYQYGGFQVYLPRWSVLTDTNKTIKVYTTEDYYYYPGTVGNVELSVIEGTPKKYTYVSSGLESETFTIYNDSIDNDQFEIFIVSATGEVLNTVNVVDNLYFVYDTVNYSCEVTTSLDQQSVDFKFGDGITARKLVPGEYILVKYAETSGADGDIGSTGVITTFQDTIYDSSGNTVTLYLTNEEAITGGSDVEDIESIRQNAPNLFFSGYRLGSEGDWSTLLASVSYVYKAIVWTISSVGGSSASAEQNQVFITAISSEGENLTTAQQEDLIDNYINEKKCLTEAVSFQDFEKIYTKFEIVGKIQNKTITVMDQLIKQTLYDNYGVINTDFQTSIYDSNFYSVINNIEDVVRHTTTSYYIEKDLSPLITNRKIFPSYTSEYTTILERQIYLLEDTVKLWIKRKVAGAWLDLMQMGYTDTTDNTLILGMNGYSISNGSILYSQNELDWSIDTIINNDPQNLIPAISSSFITDGTEWWSKTNGSLQWNTSEAYYTANGNTGTNSIYRNSLVLTGLTYTIKFKAKSATMTSKPEVYLDTTKATETACPNLTTSYQDYEFECLAPDVSTNSLILKFGTSLTNGTILYITDIEIVEKLPSGSFGVKNPADTDEDGYIIYLEYKTKDGYGQQTNSIRIPGFNQISDLEQDDFVTTTLTYI